LSGSFRKNGQVSRAIDTDHTSCDGSNVPDTQTRSCRGHDLDVVKTLIMESGLSAEGLEDQFPEGYVVAESAGDIIGCAGVEIHGACGLLRSVAVIPHRRGEKTGEKLVTNRLDWARSRGITAVYLLTDAAENYFVRLGFERIDRTTAPVEIRASHEYSVMCPETADVMLIRL